MSGRTLRTGHTLLGGSDALSPSLNLAWIVPIATAVFLCLRFVFPGEIPLLDDEAWFLNRALDGNDGGYWVDHGFQGTLGIAYGPFAMWCYQIAFRLTRNLALISLVKNATTISLACASIWIVAGVLGWAHRRALLLLLAMLSPYLWFYGRDLWDNSVVIPLTAVSIASYLVFLQRSRGEFERYCWFSVSLLCCTAAALTHLMSMAVVVGIGLHCILFERNWLIRNSWKLLPVFVLAATLSIPYALYLNSAHPLSAISGRMTSPNWVRMLGGHLQGALNPLLAPRYFSFVGFDYLAGQRWWWPQGVWTLLIPIAYFTSAFAFVFTVAGFLQFAGDFRWGRERSASCLVLLIFGIHWAVSATQKLADFPHYLNGIWFVVFLCAARGIEWGLRQQWFQRLLTAYFVASAICLSFYVAQIHLHGGTRFNTHGPILQNKLELAHEFNEYSADSPILLAEGLAPAGIRSSLGLLRRLEAKGEGPLKRARLKVVYASALPRDARFRFEITPMEEK